MKRITFIIVGSAFALFLGGCSLIDSITGINIFNNLDKPIIPTAAEIGDMDAEELLAALDDLTESDDFYDDLDDDTKQAILDGLADITDGGVPTDPEALADYQEAALLTAEIELNTTDGEQVIDSIIDVLFDTGEGSGDFLEDLIRAAFADVAREDFDETMDAIQAAADAYALYGNSLSDLDGDGEVDAPPGSNIGAIAQDALISMVVASVVGELGRADVEAFIYDDDPFDAVPTNPVDTDPGNGYYAPLQNILEASGLDETFGVS